MSIPKRGSQPGTYFVTSATAQRRRIFKVQRNAEILIETLQHYRQAGLYKLHAFVVMPDHVHLLLTPQEITIERALGFIKGGFSRSLNAPHTPWQRGFTDHRIRDKDEFLIRRNYIDRNPVDAGLVVRAEDYPYSSAYRPQEKSTPAAEAALQDRGEWHG